MSVQKQDISHDDHKPGSSVRLREQRMEHLESPSATATAAGGLWSTEKGKYLFTLARDFNSAVDECAAGAKVNAVHRVRTGSRRIQAVLEITLQEAGPAGQAFKKPVKAWLRQMKKIRRAAGPVRDLDVHRKLLQRLLEQLSDNRTKPSPEGDGAPAQMDLIQTGRFGVESVHSQVRAQAQALDKWLKSRRDGGAASDLKKLVKKRRQKLREKQFAFFLAVESHPDPNIKPPRAAGDLALEAFGRLADAMPSLDAGNLHEFRKRVKRARYVAESGGKEQAVAKTLKQMQDVIGDWHDWQCLAEESKAALGQDGAELLVWLTNEAGHALAVALKTTEQIRSRLLSEWSAARAKPSAVADESQRKPPGRVPGPQPVGKMPAPPEAA